MRINRENFFRFFDRKGFYIVLFLSVVVIAATAVYVTDSNLKKIEEIRKAQQEEINSAIESNTQYEEEVKEAKEERAAVKNDSIMNKTEGKKESELEGKQGKEVNEKTDTKEVFSTEVKKLAVTPLPPKTEKKSLASGRLTLIMPLEGKVLMEFAVDKLVYSKTLREWTTHKGIDIEG
ncbi:MAG: M23 family peptidase, partial [Caldanaerobacter sp.]